MGRITANVGLITGVPIQDTVDQLIAVAARPRDLLVSRTRGISSQQVAVTELTARVLGTQFGLDRLGNAEIFEQSQAFTSNSALLTATVTGTASLGSYQFTPLRQAQTQQAISSGFASATEALGGGSFSFRRTAVVDKGISLDLLNGGQGVERGRIQITDRSGDTAVIDLRAVRTTDEVLDAINTNTDIKVTAEVRGDTIRLVDRTGQTTSNLIVEEVGLGTTASDLGLGGINAAQAQADGQDVLKLYDKINLSSLNDGLGVHVDDSLPELEITFGDGSRSFANFHASGQIARNAEASLFSTNGSDAALRFTAVNKGEDYDDVTIVFEDDPAVTVGNETVEFDDSDPENKRLVFKIDAGNTSAEDIKTALGGSLLEINTIAGGGAADDVRVVYINNAAITGSGRPAVVYDDSDPDDVTLTIHIREGETTAGEIVAAVNANEDVNSLFEANLTEGSAASGLVSTAASFFEVSFLGGDGTGLIDVSDTATTGGGAPTEGKTEVTLGQILETLNSVAPEKLKAEIGPDGDRLVLTDLTTAGSGTFSVGSLFGATTAKDLGLAGSADGDTLTSDRLLAGLQGSLLRNFGGGDGLDALGTIDITDRDGSSATIDLADADSLQDVIHAINDSGLGVTARVNDARNGVVIEDTTSGDGNLVIASSGEISTTAESLGIEVDDAVSSVGSGSLALAVVNRNTRLDDLNGGQGIDRSLFIIRDSNSKTATVNLDSESMVTVGDLLDAMTSAGAKINAQINDQGDGIIVTDEAGGTGTLRISDISGTAAADLGIAGFAETAQVDGEDKQVLLGSSNITITLDEEDTLGDLADKINDSNGEVTASILNAGTGSSPFRLSLVSQQAGADGTLTFDTSGVDFSIKETVKGQDALLIFGGFDGGQSGLLVASNSNTFTDVIAGVDLQVNGVTGESVAVSVEADDSQIVSYLNSFVTAFNASRETLNKYTVYNEIEQTVGVLFGSSETLRVESDLGRVLTGRFFGVGSIESIGTIGLKLTAEGMLEFDESKLHAQFARDPESLKSFFTDENNGLVKKYHDVTETLVGRDSSLLVSRSIALGYKIEQNGKRVADMTDRLDNQRERLLEDFIRMEVTIAKLQSNLVAIDQIQYIGADGT